MTDAEAIEKAARLLGREIRRLTEDERVVEDPGITHAWLVDPERDEWHICVPRDCISDTDLRRMDRELLDNLYSINRYEYADDQRRYSYESDDCGVLEFHDDHDLATIRAWVVHKEQGDG